MSCRPRAHTDGEPRLPPTGRVDCHRRRRHAGEKSTCLVAARTPQAAGATKARDGARRDVRKTWCVIHSRIVDTARGSAVLRCADAGVLDSHATPDAPGLCGVSPVRSRPVGAEARWPRRRLVLAGSVPPYRRCRPALPSTQPTVKGSLSVSEAARPGGSRPRVCTREAAAAVSHSRMRTAAPDA